MKTVYKELDNHSKQPRPFSARTTLTYGFIFLLLLTAGCAQPLKSSGDFNAIKSYTDIPGVTDEEKAAVESLKASRAFLSYGHMLETEAYRLPDQTTAGFTVQLCELLTELFGINFVPQLHENWDSLKNSLDTLEIDFTGELTPTAQREQLYHMTYAIADRPLRIITRADSDKIKTESDVEGCTLGFYKDTITADSILHTYPFSFNIVYVNNDDEAIDMLRSGVIDAMVVEAVADPSYDKYDDISSRIFFSLIYTPVSMSTANPELEAIISVMDKYLLAGGIDKLQDMYKQSDKEYVRYKLHKSFTAEEKAYLTGLAEYGGIVKIAPDADNYPVSFYNKQEKTFQGIAIDILAEAGQLTGLTFKPSTSPETSWLEVLNQLRSGEVSLVTELLYSDERSPDFIWLDKPNVQTSYALLSKMNYPNLSINQIIRLNVGVLRGSVYENMYRLWFPNNDNLILYNTLGETFDALESGEIELLMASELILDTLTNYRENPGYKINISFNTPIDSLIGLNKDETLLLSILNKTMAYVNIDEINRNWLSRTFNYSKQMANLRASYLLAFSITILMVLILAIALLLHTKRLSKILVRQTEEAKIASKAKSMFLANMSHEIRTPMNGIIGLTDMIMGEKLSPRLEQYVKDIKTSAGSLLGIINDILDLSKISEGRLQIVPVDVDLKLLLANIVSMMSFTAKSKGLDFIENIRLNSPEYVKVDDVRLNQIIINLLSNAIKFTKNGYVKLTAKIEDSSLIFEISDTGIGIRPEDVQLIFIAFEQADMFKNRAIKGTGLGLSISKSIVELMGGKIWLESEYGKGTTFYVTIPYVEGDGTAVKNIDTEFKFLSAPNAKVLLVDDIQTNLTVGAGLLRMCDITADIALSGSEAIECVQAKDYDIVFMDHMMPEMDGIEAMHHIRELGSKYASLPIIALTANALNESKELLLSSGMDDFLAKPIDKSELINILQKWLPEERIEVGVRAIGQALSYTDVLDAASKIEGLDIELALSRMSGLQDVLEKSIEQVAFDINGKLKEMDDHLTKGNLRDLAIQAHGMKGALANIGATNNSELAAELEVAAKTENTQLCIDKFAVYASTMESFATQLKSVFKAKEIQYKTEDKPLGDQKLLKLKLDDAIASIESFEAADALSILNHLLEFTFGEEADESLKNAITQLNAFHYDSAASELTRLGEKL